MRVCTSWRERFIEVCRDELDEVLAFHVGVRVMVGVVEGHFISRCSRPAGRARGATLVEQVALCGRVEVELRRTSPGDRRATSRATITSCWETACR